MHTYITVRIIVPVNFSTFLHTCNTNVVIIMEKINKKLQVTIQVRFFSIFLCKFLQDEFVT
jgi:DNA-binding transcriptional regulator/RsmH inhibitor MraZ